MAAIDFPASPANAQIFSAPNGVTYRYQSSPGMWLAVGQAAGGGDFHAYNSGTSLFGPGSGAIIPDTVLTGNSGGWYSTSTGRYTPPAGRYLIMGGGTLTVTGAGGSNVQVQIRKNGVALGGARVTAYGGQVLAATSYYGDPQGTAIVDANGTDYFDLFCTVGVSQISLSNYWFSAFPISGIQGPPGLPPSALVLYSESVLASAAADIRVTIPPNTKKIELVYAVNNVGNVDAQLLLQCMQGATPVTSAIYNGQLLYGGGTTVTTGHTNGSNGWINGNASYQAGTARPMAWPLIPGWAGELSEFGQNAANTIKYSLHHSLSGGPDPATVTGFRLVNATAVNFVAGSFMRCFVVV